jgi:Fur family zinc uptake transcriptional regulator
MVFPQTVTQAQPNQGLNLPSIQYDRVIARLTRNQHKIFTKLDSLGRAAGAYELLDLLRGDGVNAIPTIYRALNSLTEKGLVYHIMSTRTFITTPVLNSPSGHKVLLVCHNCHDVSLLDANDTVNAVKYNAEQTGFEIRSAHMEILGTCSKCQTLGQQTKKTENNSEFNNKHYNKSQLHGVL